MTTIQLLPYIIKANPEIQEFTFQRFPSSVMLQDHLPEWKADEQQMFDFAIRMRDEYHLPFWDGIMMSTFGNPYASERVMMQALRHNQITKVTHISVNNIEQEFSLPLDNLALCAEVILRNGEHRYLPMLDFHIPTSSDNIKIAEMVCRLLELGQGWLIESGESYHFIGSKLYTWQEQHDKLCQALLFTPILDKAWISHQLREKTCSLRIGLKHGVMPKVCHMIGSIT